MQDFESQPENLDGLRSITDSQNYLSLAYLIAAYG